MQLSSWMSSLASVDVQKSTLAWLHQVVVWWSWEMRVRCQFWRAWACNGKPPLCSGSWGGAMLSARYLSVFLAFPGQRNIIQSERLLTKTSSKPSEINDFSSLRISFSVQLWEQVCCIPIDADSSSYKPPIRSLPATLVTTTAIFPSAPWIQDCSNISSWRRYDSTCQ